MHLAAYRFPLFTALCCALLLVVAAAAPAGAASADNALQLSTAPLNPAYLQTLVNPLFSAPSSAADGRALGLRPGPQDFSYAQGIQVPASRNAPLRGALPATYDLRSLGRVTSVKDQGSFGTCWAFASFGSLESGLLPGETRDFSEDNMVLKSGFNYPGTLYDAGGQIWMSTAYLTRWGGPVYESDDAYGDSYTPAGLTPRKHVQEVNWIPGRGSSLDNDNIKNAIMQYGGAYVAFGWSAAFYRASTASFYRGDSSSTNHAVLIVGWDDTYPSTNFGTTPPGDGAFIVRNSWGTSWGSSGYFYVSYYDTSFGRGMMGVFDNAEPTSNYTGIYQYDPLGD
ncbi:MAG TPA: C1 family peptidase, partial [Thermoleophilia bacterium]|nr:C1 family peptidase [Thermoleophilia bacterium]